jgi:glycerophosphoryl diester phosphodiesterase
MAGPWIIGHRGAAGHAPENTMASFTAALGMGVDGVEFDVQFTRDLHPVILHDETLERMAGVAVRVTDHAALELSGFDIGFRSGPVWRGQRIPFVDDVARLIPPPLQLHAEIKDYAPVTDAQIGRLLQALERHGGLDRAVISSPHEEVLSAVKRQAPAARTALLLFRDVRHPVDAARRAALLGCHAVNPNAALVTEDLVEVCHRHHMKVLAFTVNERGVMRTLSQKGVDGFFTDYPDRLSVDDR